MTDPNFFPFSPSDKSKWKSQVEKDLKGKDFEKTLVSTVWGKIKQHPYYDSSDTSFLATAMDFHEPVEIPALGPRHWTNAVEIFPSDSLSSNKEILNHLQNGADALVIHCQESMDWEKVLKNVLLEYIHIYITPDSDKPESLFEFFDFIEKSGLPKEKLKGAILWSPADALFENNSDWNKNLELAQKLIESSKDFPHFQALTIKFARYANAGASGITETFLGLSELIELVDGLQNSGLSPKVIFENLAFHSCAGRDHFPEMVKLKSLRVLIPALGEKFGVTVSPSQIHLIVSSSLWTKSLIDQNNNFIRQTYEAISAILGGCNTLWIRPIEGENASTLSKRVARNISSILREESHLDKVMDPTAGSYYIESLMKDFINSCIDEISKIEAEGGWLKAFQKREIHKLVRAEREAIQKAIYENQLSEVGVNRYLASGKLINNLPFKPIPEKEFQLLPSRESYLIEQETLQA
ncbi:hypothetical protein E4S40_12330 [Algoriphagus kandeliae]|uniref:Methylmalonyl-CoA mutase alpha/beta chain catalytic domain-containing protein n=1 Tax=Algoriphagus kandeliae TaxID=2562278 RepID=A0A4Y9QMI6_9BACT|nr:methylmalonyl-CoA mutase family protein [Algoriphagus kandeliae]TFV93048.1 hypothetical protein E4S40_12330 [Algoriphagus kandeliae]